MVREWDYSRVDSSRGILEKPGRSVYHFETLTGMLYIRHEKCETCPEKPCVDSCSAEILKFDGGKPVLAIAPEEAKRGRCTECLACELACEFHGNKAIFIDLPIPGLVEAMRMGA